MLRDMASLAISDTAVGVATAIAPVLIYRWPIIEAQLDLWPTVSALGHDVAVSAS